MEMYDMKPEAPKEYRGEFMPIKPNVPGMEVCELFPRHAKIADKYNIIRSIHHDFAGRPMPMLPFGEPIPELNPVT